MRIAETQHGWTLLNDVGEVKLRTEDGEPLYLPTRADVKAQCLNARLYEVKEGNPAGLPAGTLVGFSAV